MRDDGCYHECMLVPGTTSLNNNIFIVMKPRITEKTKQNKKNEERRTNASEHRPGLTSQACSLFHTMHGGGAGERERERSARTSPRPRPRRWSRGGFESLLPIAIIAREGVSVRKERNRPERDRYWTGTGTRSKNKTRCCCRYEQ
mmetsp:Transcript_9376/g.21471  ORF Transcript_9376/g.21471 Transcript_9376/m.21471 type:complete len:145 (+) Transcript_9376:296-730(+)